MHDAHCHFNAAFASTWFRPEHVYLLNATDPSQFADLAEFRENHSRSVRIGYGVHPCYLHLCPDLAAALDEIRARLAADQTAFVGEIGLDTRPAVLADSPLDAQLRYFSPQLEMAFELNRDCSIHIVSRRPGLWPILAEQLETMVAKHPGYNRSVIMHSYGGTRETFRKLQGAVAACRGRVLFSVSRFAETSKAARTCVRGSDRDCLLLETDWCREDEDDWDRSMETAIGVLMSERGLSRDEILSLVAENWRRHDLLPAAQSGM